MDSLWRIELFGWLRAVRGDQIVSRFQTQKTGALLAFLAYHRHRSHPRDVLVELLWPECAPAAGRHRLCQALYSLRCQLEPPGVPAGAVLFGNRATVQLNPAAGVTDVGQFEAALQVDRPEAGNARRIERLEAAAALYRGELLLGYYEDWITPERQRLAEGLLQALRELIGLLEQAGDLGRALHWAGRAVSIDPLGEESHHGLIRLLAQAGQPEAALRQYHELERRLAEDLGTAPSHEIRLLGEDLARGRYRPERQAAAGADCGHEEESDGARAASAIRPSRDHHGERHSTAARDGDSPTTVSLPLSAKGPASPARGLPLQLTRIFGREREIARLRELLLEPETRLVTLTGFGGVGKTRLAIQTGRVLPDFFAGGVWFVPLLALSDPRLIADQLLVSLDLARSPRLPALEQVTAYLRRQPPALFLLDNFEHLVAEGAPTVRALLEQVEGLTLLVTSRQRLGLEGEREFPVAPLPVPVVSGQWSVASCDKDHEALPPPTTAH